MRSVVLVLALGLGGCGFGQGFRDGMLDEGARAAAEAAADAIDAKLGDDFRELAAAVKTIPTGIPKPEPPKDNTLMYTLGMLAAGLVTAGVKGSVRQKWFSGKAG